MLQSRLSNEIENQIASQLFDRMTEQRYTSPINSFKLPIKLQSWTEIDILGRGMNALKEISNEMGLAFDEWDLQYYTKLFRDVFKRNPTSVECFDLAQSNSEHSRHWFFKGRLIVDGVEIEKNLIEMIVDTQKFTNDNNVIKFSDNSSAIKGFELNVLSPVNAAEASLVQLQKCTRHIIFTAETHNFPTGVAPFQGATTGTGGRIRDVQAAGRGGHVIAATAGYSFGNLLIPGYSLPWEDSSECYPYNFASPVDICIEASNGASDYGNKFGEPVLAGFARSFGNRLPNDERWEWIKPIMFSGGIGSIDARFVTKLSPEKNMLIVKVGGPVYRIGVGGGAASSTEVQGCYLETLGDEKNEELDFGAVQRGDAEMEQKLNRVIRACIEYSGENPIQSIHDQGAGGNGNVLKEIVDPKGAVIYTTKFSLGDPTIDTLELWGAEYQESNAILINESDKNILTKIGEREKCPINFVGTVSDDGFIKLVEGDEQTDSSKLPVNLELSHVLGSMPPKVFNLEKKQTLLRPLQLPENLTLLDALNRVLRLPSVASKRYLTNKVDRSVTGLVAQQQCVGYTHTPLCDYAMIALSFFDIKGSATSIGEQPIKGLLSPAAGARMSVAEAITNLMFAGITDLADVKCSGNWMWAAKLPGEGAKLFEACQAMCQLMKVLRIGIDGGKDSLSMAAKVKSANKKTEVVKAPGTLVISTYAPVADIRQKVTPEIKGDGKLIYINLSGLEKMRNGGSALAQVYGQIGSEPADIDKPELLRDCFEIVQKLIKSKRCTAGHDISDGGILVCLLEMAFATNCGIVANFNFSEKNVLNALFSEECGVIIEVLNDSVDYAMQMFKEKAISAQIIGEARFDNDVISVSVNGTNILESKTAILRDIWEETSFELEKRQANVDCVISERVTLKQRKQPDWKLTFNANDTRLSLSKDREFFTSKPRVAVVREEGINGDREMIASLYMVGFEVADVVVTDILGCRVSISALPLDSFRGLIFPGGFSYADVLGSARGWAATMKFNEKADNEMKRFKARSNTFSLGVCNGCQLMALLGWVGEQENGTQGTLLAHNDSERFESRFVSVKIKESNAIMLKDMHDSVLGVWIAHGEGKFTFTNDNVLHKVIENKCIALCYVDDDGKETTKYPFNPNGSIMGIAGICSDDGRHLAMMPHPERCTQMWHWPYVPPSWNKVEISPWTKMFRNAYDWCLNAV
ncbi:phosphoribosylformylglycinamidine synthase-like protein [Leptotrombidium deliense]|uniref:Phosphoribosylformylglycinamidine synthase n=1 Tax=Leptotrombidium deliense TaxID=299467 RepID=A0A443SF42_9ACAR|nr:phosphoribosylformylglycinamidine synthase-like protein [Leptotrombidium deliense]